MLFCYIKIFFQEPEFQGSKDFIFNTSLYLKDVYLLVFFFFFVLRSLVLALQDLKQLSCYLPSFLWAFKIEQMQPDNLDMGSWQYCKHRFKTEWSGECLNVKTSPERILCGDSSSSFILFYFLPSLWIVGGSTINIYKSNSEKDIVYIKDPSLFTLSSPISHFGRNEKTTYKRWGEYVCLRACVLNRFSLPNSLWPRGL